MRKFGPRDFLFWLMWVALVVFAGANVANMRGKEDAEEQVQILREKNRAKVPLSEYNWIVHSLDRCNWRLDEEQQDNFQMKDEVDHWSYISRLVNSADPDTECMLLIAKATRDFLWEAEDDLYQCQSIRDRECWCPWPDN